MNDAADAADASGEDDDAKIIVRSNGTVTYVGKDIAYQLWKFGLLGRDFQYEKFHTYANGHALWSSVSSGGAPDAPAFGGAAVVYNVIDARQAYLQNVVVAGLRSNAALGELAANAPAPHIRRAETTPIPKPSNILLVTVKTRSFGSTFLKNHTKKGAKIRTNNGLSDCT